MSDADEPKTVPAELPRLIAGDLAVDDRGQVAFVNDFRFEGVKRCYLVSNHAAGFVRAWQGHRHEAKYMMVVQGTAVVGAVAIDDWARPSRATRPHRYVLSAKKPSALYIPPGYANGFMSLSSDTQLMVFATSSLEDLMADDFRFDACYWDIWKVESK